MDRDRRSHRLNACPYEAFIVDFARGVGGERARGHRSGVHVLRWACAVACCSTRRIRRGCGCSRNTRSHAGDPRIGAVGGGSRGNGVGRWCVYHPKLRGSRRWVKRREHPAAGFNYLNPAPPQQLASLRTCRPGVTVGCDGLVGLAEPLVSVAKVSMSVLVRGIYLRGRHQPIYRRCRIGVHCHLPISAQSGK